MSEELLPLLDSTTEPARAAVSLTYKKNLGNFENINVFVSLTDSARQDENPQDLLDRVYEEVEVQLEKRIAEIARDLGV